MTWIEDGLQGKRRLIAPLIVVVKRVTCWSGNVSLFEFDAFAVLCGNFRF
jgi:hypothetical protein